MRDRTRFTPSPLLIDLKVRSNGYLLAASILAAAQFSLYVGYVWLDMNGIVFAMMWPVAYGSVVRMLVGAERARRECMRRLEYEFDGYMYRNLGEARFAEYVVRRDLERARRRERSRWGRLERMMSRTGK